MISLHTNIEIITYKRLAPKHYTDLSIQNRKLFSSEPTELINTPMSTVYQVGSSWPGFSALGYLVILCVNKLLSSLLSCKFHSSLFCCIVGTPIAQSDTIIELIIPVHLSPLEFHFLEPHTTSQIFPTGLDT